MIEPKKCPTCGHVERRIRSNQQNRFYHSVVVGLIADHTGYSADETHEILKFKFLKKWRQIETKQGIEEIEYIGSTADLNTVQFEEMIVKIREWAWVTLGVSIPNPNESL